MSNATHYTSAEKVIIRANTIAAQIYHRILVNDAVGKPALKYLHNRKVDNHVIHDYQLGFAPKKGIIHDYLRKHGYTDSQLLKTGLCTKGKNNNIYDYFFNRIMYPIKDHNGYIIAFSGRVIHTNASPAKYLNTQETAVFHKGKTIFNLDKAKASIKQHHHVILVEGYMDVLSAYQAHITNVIASMGTGLTKDQIQILKRYTHHITVCYDGDLPGQDAIHRALKLLDHNNLARTVIQMPSSIDPDEYRRKYGDKAFRKYIQANTELPITFELKHLKLNLNMHNITSQLNYLKQAIHILANIKPTRFLNRQTVNRLLDIYISNLAKAFHVRSASFRQDIDAVRALYERQHNWGKPARDSLQRAEQMLLYACIKRPAITKRINLRNLGATPAYIEIFNIIRFYYRKHHEINVKNIAYIIKHDRLSSDYHAILSFKHAAYDKKAVRHYIKNIKYLNEIEYWYNHMDEHLVDALRQGNIQTSLYLQHHLSNAMSQFNIVR